MKKNMTMDDLHNIARVAYNENNLRREMSNVFKAAMMKREMSAPDLAYAVFVKPSQIKRLLHEEVGGSLELKTILRAADYLGLDVVLSVTDLLENQRKAAALERLEVGK